jgi:hypothetical protein
MQINMLRTPLESLMIPASTPKLLLAAQIWQRRFQKLA